MSRHIVTPVRAYAALLLTLLACPAGRACAEPTPAEDSATSGAPTPSTEIESASRSDDPSLSLSTYLWMTSLSGTVGAAGLETDVDQSFFDVLGTADKVYGLMATLDIEYERLVFQVNGVYTHAEVSDERTRVRSGPGGGGPAVGVDVDVEVDTAWFETLAGYRIYQAERADKSGAFKDLAVDVFVGARVTDLQIDIDALAAATLSLPGGRTLTAGIEKELDGDKTWVEPFVGARLGARLGDHWRVQLRADIGGFGIDNSDFSWQAVALAGYEWRVNGWTITLFGGYRALGQDYSDGGFTWDTVVHGPVLGAQFSFYF